MKIIDYSLKEINKYLKIFLIFLFISIGFNTTFSADFKAVQNGDWNDNNTWGGSSFPNSEVDNVEISGYSVSINGANALANNIIIGENGTLTFSTANSLTVYGNLTNNGTINFLNSSGLTLKGSFTNNGTISNYSTLDLTIDGDASVDLTLPKDFLTLNSITINKTDFTKGLILDTTLTVTNDVNVNSGVLNLSTRELTVNGNITFGNTGTIVTDSLANLYLNGVFNYGSNLESSFDIHSTLTVSNSSTITNSGNGTIKFNDITVNSGATLFSNSAFSVAGDISNSGNWNCESSTITFDNNSTELNAKTISSTSSMTFSTIVINGASAVSNSADIVLEDAQNFTFEVYGDGSFVANSGTITVGETGLDGDLNFIVDGTAKVELNDFVINKLNLTVSTNDDITIKGDLKLGANASFIGITPSTINFKNTSTSSNAKNIINSGTQDKLQFHNLNIENSSAIISSSSFDIKGDLTVGYNSYVEFNGSSTVSFINSGTKTLTNNGVLIFKNLSIESAAGDDNIVNTRSNFKITGELLAQGSDADPLNGSLIALGNSKITLSGNSITTPTNEQTVNGNSIQFQNLKITGTNVSSNKNFWVKGDFDISGSYSANSGTISFKGTDKQILSGTTATFSSVTIDNINGMELQTNMLINGNIYLNNGDIDLSGSHTITLANTSSKLYETPGNTIKNTHIGEGGSTGGYIGSQQIALKTNVVNTGLGISIANGNSSNITVKRYHSPKTIDSVKSIKRYYRLDYSGANIGDVTINYDNSELNGNTASSLYLFYASSDNTDSWTRTSSTVTTSEGINTGSIIATGLTGLGSPVYFTLAPLKVKFFNLPYSGIDTNNQIASSPLVAGSQNVNLLAFGINTPIQINTIDSLKIALHSSTFTNQIENFDLMYDTDRNLTTTGLTSTSASITNQNDTLIIKGITLSTLSSGNNYFYLVGDVSSTVTTSNASVSFTLSSDKIYMSSAEVNTIDFSSPSFSFTQLYITADADNTPSGSLTSSATLTNQPIFAFTLTPTDNAPSATFTALDISVTSSSYTHFSDIKLWNDVDKNGYYSSGDIALGSSGTITASLDTISYSGFSSTITESEDYLITAIVSSSAQTYSNIKVTINDESWIIVSSNATVTPFSSTLSGNTMTVAASSTVSKLAIKDISAVTPVEGFSSNEFETGQTLVLTLEAQDSNGKPQGVLSPTEVTFTISAGSATITNNSATISAFNSQATISNFILTNPNGASGIDVQAASTGLTSATFSSITLFASEPTTAPSGLTATNVSTSSASISWTHGTPANYILIAKEGGTPSPPSNGSDYTQATSNNFSNPNDSTGAGSYVVYKGSSNSINITGLSPSTKYYFTVYNYSGTGNGIRYKLDRYDGDMIVTIDTVTQSSQPSTQASNLTISNPSDTSLTLNWTNGNGNKRIVLGRLNSAVTDIPVDGKSYVADSNFGFGSQIGNSFVVYSGTGNSVTVQNLAPSTTEKTNTYYFAVFEYNDSLNFQNYLTTSSATASRRTLAQEPTVQASNIEFITGQSGSGYYSDDNSVLVSWVNGNGEGRIVICSSTITSNEIPQDGRVSFSTIPSTPGADVLYGSTDTVGNAFVVYNGTGETNSVRVTGLTFGRKYYFRVFEYNGSGASASTSTTNFLTDTATGNPNSRISDKYEPNDSYSELGSWNYITTDGTEYSGVLTGNDDEDWFYFEPNVADGESNLRIVLKNLPANYELDLYNYTGTRLLRRSRRTNQDDEIIILNNVPRGRYYIRIYTQSDNTTESAYKIRVEAETNKIQSSVNY